MVESIKKLTNIVDNSSTSLNKRSISNSLLFYFIIVFASLLYFLFIVNPAHYYFLNDDYIHIPLAAKRRFLHGYLVRPFSDLTLWLDYLLWGRNAYGYHLTNVIIHLINTILLFILARILFRRYGRNKLSADYKSVFVAILFLLYAYHSEPLFWIIGRGGSLSTLFLLSSFIVYLKDNQTAYIASLFLFLIALLTYEIAFAFPIMLTFLFLYDRKSQHLYRLLGFWLFFLAFGTIRWIIIGSIFNNYATGAFINFDLSRIFYNYNTLFGRTFLPPMKSSILFLTFYLVLLFLISIILILQRNKFLFFLIAGLLITLLPVLSLGIDTHDSESERFIYLGSVFVCLFIIEVLSTLNRNIFSIVAILLIVFHALFLYRASESYRLGSMVARKSLECISSKNANNITVVDLPSQYKGALIFRIGFPEAVAWIGNEKETTVNILSQKELVAVPADITCKIDSVTKMVGTTFILNQTKGNGILEMEWKANTLKFVYGSSH